MEANKILFRQVLLKHSQERLKDNEETLLKCFAEEIDAVKKIFGEQRDNPPLHKNMPEVVSRMMWVHALQERIRVRMLFLIVSQLLILWVIG